MKKLAFPILISLFLIIIPLKIQADGMIAPPRDYYMYESDQKAVIFYEDGVENLIISIKFRGDADDFAWIVPTPSRPEVTKSTQELFANLESLTGTVDEPLPLFEDFGLGDVGGRDKVEVIEEKQIEYYDVTILSATDQNALFDWLNSNGYSYPLSKKYILTGYVTNGWYFTAMKINAEAASSSISSSLKSGQALPIKFTFETNKIVYPLKISQVMAEATDDLAVQKPTADLAISIPNVGETLPLTNTNSNTNSNSNTNTNTSTTTSSIPTYKDGKSNSGVYIGNINDTPNYPAEKSFFEKEGTIEMWVNPRGWENSAGGYWELINVVDGAKRDVFEFRRGLNYSNKKENLQMVFYKPTSGYTIWKTELDSLIFEDDNWYHLAVTWQVNSEPQLYVNGQAQKLSTAYSGTGWSMRSAGSGKIYLGQRGNSPGPYTARAILDEVRISNRAKTAQEISELYSQADLSLSADSNTLFLANLDDNLTVKDKDSDTAGTLSYTVEKSKTRNIGNIFTYPTRIPVLLYVISDHKKELTNYTTQYANWIKTDDLKDLASVEGDPWISPSGKKYFLTKLYASLSPSDMTEDLYPKDASNNDLVNAQGESESNRMIFFILVIIGSAITLGSAFFIIREYRSIK